MAGDSVLLLADTDPGLPGSRWWVTPGGGIDPGESAAEAAVREVAEELGLVTTVEALLGPIAVREVVHGYSDQVLHQHESFFILVLDAEFAPTQDGLTADEQITLDGWAWIPLIQVGSQPQQVWPQDLLYLVALTEQPERWPLDLGVIEESTLPVDRANVAIEPEPAADHARESAFLDPLGTLPSELTP